MVFTRFVEVGRIALVNYGDDFGRLVCIVDIVDGPTSGVARQTMPYSRLNLTDIVVEVEKGASTADVKSAMADVEADFGKTVWGQKIANKKKRASLTDFERYKVMVARQKRAKIIKAAM